MHSPSDVPDIQPRPAEDIPPLWKDLSIFSCTQHPSDALLASACSDGNVHITALQQASLQPVRMLPVAEDLGTATMCSAAAFSGDGRLLAVGARCSAVLVYCASSWKLLHVLKPPAIPGSALGATGCSWDTQVQLPASLCTSLLVPASLAPLAAATSYTDVLRESVLVVWLLSFGAPPYKMARDLVVHSLSHGCVDRAAPVSQSHWLMSTRLVAADTPSRPAKPALRHAILHMWGADPP